jgi:predicted hotdog family 3-hydroxylacyl-ACP dehydratase
MIAQGSEILQFIPQRPPIVMVDKLISAADKITVSGLFITDDNIFVRDGKLQEPGIIENIAQSAALGIGFVYRLRGDKIPLGFIGALKNLQIFSLPECGQEIHTTIEVEYEVFDATIIIGKIFCRKLLIAQTEMKIFLKTGL